MVYAAKRKGLGGKNEKKPARKHDRRYSELSVPGEKVQIDVKEVPYCCLRGGLKRDGKHLYQWTAIDECIRYRFVYGFEEHLIWSNNKTMRTLGRKSPIQLLQEKLLASSES